MLGKKHSISQNDNFSETILSNKPLWISDVKASLSSFFPSSMSQSSFEQIKDIMKFFMLIIISSIFGSFVFPVGGFVLSIGIFIYATQVILKFTKRI